ncbi:substance-K receptor-like [Pollicipes pollicipes]|uniref:substance-K receptor-like n=1 Tax=Pollicipes pollicipes TaxID=41117 RepID=UPI001885A241|nr:substance-K receptor-like [Pollicipes pollicipes]
MWEAYEVVVCVLTVLNGVVSVCGNFTFIVMFCRKRQLLTPMNAYLVSVSVASLVVGLVVISGISYFSRPYHLGFDTPHVCLYQWVKACLITLSSIGIIYCMLAIAVERYRTCMGPRSRGASLSSTFVSIGVIWAAALAYTAATKYLTFQRLEAFAVLIDRGRGTNVTAPPPAAVTLKLCHYCASAARNVWHSHLVYFSLGYVLPLALMTYLYACVIRRLARNLRRNRHNNTERAKMRAIKAMVVNVCVFAVSWVPFFLVQMMAPLYAPRLLAGGRTEVIAPSTRLFFDFCVLFGTSNSWVHIIVLLRYTSQFSATVRELSATRFSAETSQTVVAVCQQHRLSVQLRLAEFKEGVEV